MNRLHRWYCQSNHWRHRLGTEILPWSLKGVDLGGEVWNSDQGQASQRTGCAPNAGTSHALNWTSTWRALCGSVLPPRTSRCGSVTPRQCHSATRRFPLFSHLRCSTPYTFLALQDRLFCEAFRVLKPGGIFAGSDSLWSVWMQIFHFADTMVTLDPGLLPGRLEAAGFKDVGVETSGGRVRFWAKRPDSLPSGTDSLCEAPERLRLPSEE